MKFLVLNNFFLITTFMFSDCNGDVSSDTREVIRRITPNYEQHLRRAIQNEGIRRLNIRRSKNTYPLDDVLISEGETDIELRNLALSPTPDIRVTQLAANLEMLTLDVALNLGTLKVEGDYEANNRTLQRLLAVTHTGSVSIKIDGVIGNGKIGLFLREDSFVAENYDLNFEPGKVTVMVRYQGEEGSQVENEITEEKIEKTLANALWPQLTEILLKIFKQQLDAVIVEDSAMETLVDYDEDLRLHSRHLTLKANRLMDCVLCSAKGNIVRQDLRSIQTPPLTAAFKGKKGEQSGVLRTTEGYIKDLSTLTRTRDMSIYEDELNVVIYGYIEIRDFKHGYDNFTAEYQQNVVTGTIRTSIYRSKLFLKIAVPKQEGKCKVERANITNLSDVDMDSSGLGSLSWLIDRLRSWVIANLRNQAIPVLEEYIRMSFENALLQTDCLALLAD